jgi:hypothetical protein
MAKAKQKTLATPHYFSFHFTFFTRHTFWLLRADVAPLLG